MSPQNNHLQRPPAAVLYAVELAKLKQNDNAPCPPGWQLSLPAARAFILGDEAQNISRKVVISPSAVERMLVTLATGRGLMLVGEPGTAKSLLSELLATAISGDAGLTIQGGASTTEDQIKYGWNYALLINHGPSTEALVPAPLYLGMRDGKIVRFEEITRTPLEVQDCLLGMLSDRVMTVPELTGEASQLYAREGFNIIATANTRDRGVNEMSAALKRRFDFETVFPIMDFAQELELVASASARLLAHSGIPHKVPDAVLESELLATAISGDAGLTIQGGASTTEDQIKYGWNYALLINHGPSTEALVPAPLYQGMRDGKIVRFEEITRTPLEVQDCLLGMLSDRVMTVPELTGEASQLYALEGFNIIATDNTRDRGVNEMSAALKSRFDFETVFTIMDFAQELERVASASARLLAHRGIPHKVPDAVLELLVRTFRELRANGEKKTSMDTLTAIMSTAEAVNVAHAVGVRAWFLANRAGEPADLVDCIAGTIVKDNEETAIMSTAEAVNVAHAVGVRAWFLANRAGEPADLVDCIAGTIVKDNEEDRARLRRYFEQRVATHKEAHWQAYYQARHRLP